MLVENIFDPIAFPSFLGIAFGIRRHVPLPSTFIRLLKRVLRCNCRAEKGHRSRTFKHLVTYVLKILKMKTGWNLRKQRMFWRSVAFTFDRFCDTLKEIQNPLCFYSMNEDFSKNIESLFQVCRLQRPLPYFLVLPPWKVRKVQKIAEGSYGEIYTVATYSDSSDRVLKTVGVYGSPRDEPRLSLEFDTAVSDAVCSKYLSKLTDPGVFQAPNFPKVYSIDLVKGKAPKCLVEAWKDFNDNSCRDKTCHYRPDRYTHDALFLVMEMENCGKSILNCPSLSPLQALSLVLQTASALAVAECALEFEHRDLHLGNWLFRHTTQPHLSYSTEQWQWTLPTYNVQAFLIDFTMSRIRANGNVFAMDLSYLSDTGEDQNDPIFLNYNNIYRMMKDELRDDFNSYKPVTNIWWLVHIILKVQSFLLENVSTSSGVDRIALYALDRLRCNIPRYSSTMDFLKAEVFGESERQETMQTSLSQ